MTRLVNDMREKIIKAAIAHRFNSEADKLMDRGAELADRIYCDVFDAATRKRMEDLPNGWLPTDDDIYVSIGDRPHRFRFSGETHMGRRNKHGAIYIGYNARPSIHRRFPNNKHQTCCKVYDDHHGIGADALAFFEACETHADAISNACDQVRGTLYSFHTVEKLVEAWPEIAPFVPEYAPVSPAQLPAVPTTALNELFKLPVTV